MPEDSRSEKVPRSELRIEFAKRINKGGKTYYLAKTFLPLTMDLENTAFFFWPGENWKDPSMTICPVRSKPVFSQDEEPDGEEPKR